MASYNVDMIPRAIQKAWDETPQDPDWWYDKVADTPYPFNKLYQAQINKKLRQEAKRRDNDLLRNTGQGWQNSVYPFMAYESSFSARNNYGFADSFEATSSVISLYKKWW